MANEGERATRELAESHGILLAYEDIQGRRREATHDALLAILRTLGAPVERAEDAPDALRARRQELRTRALDPVIVSWEGEGTEVRVRTLGDEAPPRCGLELEDGRQIALEPPPDLPAVGWVEVEGRTVVTRALELPGDLPPGYHRLWSEGEGRPVRSLVVRAPRRAWRPGEPRPDGGSPSDGALPPDGGEGRRERLWGVFLPLYALRTGRDWGAGDFTDLEALLRWTREAGGRVVGTLPLLAAYLDEPFDPSPYAPVSRLFWNELYVDPARAPGWSSSYGAGEGGGHEPPDPGLGLLASDLRELRVRQLVDYRRLAALKRSRLEPLARRFFENGAERHEAFGAYLQDHPRVGDYARFRAAVERRGEGWPAWPARLRDGKLRPGDYDPERVRYHLFVQWVAERQLSELSGTAGAGAAAGEGEGCHLYLDLPLGAHPWGYDCWRERASFAQGATAGAPPDDFFSAGQDWGFPPLHPERMRERGYSYFIDCLRHNLRHAGALRIDHVMGLHRLFWVPEGMSATQGVYVQYPSEELWAILCLESHRQRCRLAGEDLGTVPPEVRGAMGRHGVDGLYVMQYETRPGDDPPLSPARHDQVASLNTHDMYPFAAWWEGLDVEDRRELGLLDDAEAAEERRRRAELRERLASFLQRRGRPRGGDTAAALAGALEELAAGPARTLLVNLEDLWLEPKPQNVPGTSEERPNWRRRARHDLDTIRSDEEIRARVARIDALRRNGDAWRGAGEAGEPRAMSEP